MNNLFFTPSLSGMFADFNNESTIHDVLGNESYNILVSMFTEL